MDFEDPQPSFGKMKGESKLEKGEKTTRCQASPLISIVDDDEALRSSLEDLIRSAGFRVQSFSSAEAFLTSNQVQTTDCLMRSMQHCGIDKNEMAYGTKSFSSTQ